MGKVNRDGDHQYAALPYRRINGTLEVLLITSRETGRWVIPKGWPIKNKKDRYVVALEAKEEASIQGFVGKEPLGFYPYAKDLLEVEQRIILVTVYPMLVTDELPIWPEAAERKRSWFPKETAASLVSEGSLARLIDEMN